MKRMESSLLTMPSLQWLLQFQNKTYVVDIPRECTSCDVSVAVAEALKVPQQRLNCSFDFPYLSVRIASSIRGGKGGFGTLLKSTGRQSGASATTDFSACRDLPLSLVFLPLFRKGGQQNQHHQVHMPQRVIFSR